MKVPLSWLKEYINISFPTGDLEKHLTLAGLEVEGIEEVPIKFEGVVVGEVLDCQPHPDATKLQVASVTNGHETHQVVCGAANCRKGLRVAFAMIGAKLFDEKGESFIIKKAKLRGIESNGMLCSADELGLPETSYDGILELSQEMAVGTSLASYYGDTILEIGLTPNLGHASSVYGVARELSAITGLPLKKTEYKVKEGSESIQDATSVQVVDGVRCPRYSCRMIKGVKVGPSPEWLKRRIELSGLRSINNVVDVTNYVLLELGHPLHAFDFDELEGGAIEVRTAREGELFVTLDDVERKLPATALLICDKEKPVALAGIMGGQNSQVTHETVNVLLESAYFEPKGIRRTSKQIGLATDSSRRFEKGCDPLNVVNVLDRAAALIEEVAGGTVLKGVIDIQAKIFPEKVVDCRLSRTNKLLGIQLSAGEVEQIFQKLSFGYKWDQADLFSVRIPSYRVDISIEADLIEEVARIYGYHHIPREKARYQTASIVHSPSFQYERTVRHRLLAEGLQELLTTDLISPTMVELLSDQSVRKDSIIKVMNPTSIEQSVMRPSMLPGFLQLVKHNYDHQNHNVSGYEVGRVHYKQDEQCVERLVAGIVLTGHRAPYDWNTKETEVDFYDLKGIVENLLLELGITGLRCKPSSRGNFHDGRQANLFVGSIEVGVLGEVHPSIRRQVDIPQRVYFAELDLENLFQLKRNDSRMVPLPLYPSSERDWTLTVDEQLPIDEIFSAVRSTPSSLLENVTLIDIYRSEKLGNDRKNVTIRFVYRDREKTIEQAAVEQEERKIIEGALKQLGGKVL